MNNRLTALLEFLKNDPEDSFTLYAIALEYWAQKDFISTEKYFNQLFEIDEDYLPLYMQFARFKEEQGFIDEAIKLYKMGIVKAKQSGDNHAVTEMQEFLDELNRQ